MSEEKKLKLDYKAISLILKIYGEALKKFLDKGDFDIEDLKVVENLDEIIEYVEENKKDED